MYAGSTFTVRMPDKITIPLRNKRIRSEFNGYNWGELARKYNLHEKTIRNIVSGEISRKEEMCGGCVFREECGEDASKCNWRRSDGI